MNSSVAPSGEGSVQEAALILGDLADYITSNGFFLIDFDGKPTTWGDWYETTTLPTLLPTPNRCQADTCTCAVGLLLSCAV